MTHTPPLGPDSQWADRLHGLLDAASDHLRQRASLDAGAWALVRAAADAYLPARPAGFPAALPPLPAAQVLGPAPDTLSQGGFLT